MFDDMPPVEVIPNGVDTGAFRPCDQAFSKLAWDLPADRRHILFGAVDATDDVRKGFHHMIEAVRILAERGWSDHAELVVFGGEAPSDLFDLGLPIRSVG